MTTKHTTFSNWITEQLDKREWRQSDLARLSGIGTGSLSRIISGQRGVGIDTCNAIARAFDVDPVLVHRAAGLLPAVPEATQQESQLLYAFRQIKNRQLREAALASVQGIAGQHPGIHLGDEQASENSDTDGTESNKS